MHRWPFRSKSTHLEPTSFWDSVISWLCNGNEEAGRAWTTASSLNQPKCLFSFTWMTSVTSKIFWVTILKWQHKHRIFSLNVNIVSYRLTGKIKFDNLLWNNWILSSKIISLALISLSNVRASYFKYVFIQQACAKHSNTVCADNSIVSSQQLQGLYPLTVQVEGDRLVLNAVGYPVPPENPRTERAFTESSSFQRCNRKTWWREDVYKQGQKCFYAYEVWTMRTDVLKSNQKQHHCARSVKVKHIENTEQPRSSGYDPIET